VTIRPSQPADGEALLDVWLRSFRTRVTSAAAFVSSRGGQLERI